MDKKQHSRPKRTPTEQTTNEMNNTRMNKDYCMVIIKDSRCWQISNTRKIKPESNNEAMKKK